MSLEQIPIWGPKPAPSHPQHPLGPITAAEITASAGFIKALWPSDTNLHFKTITLQEPDKADLVPFLVAEHAGLQPPSVERRAFVGYYIRNTEKLHEAVVNLTREEIEYNVRLGPNIHSSADGEEILFVEKIALADEGVKTELAKLKLPEGTVVICDPWIYGILNI